MSEIYRFSVLHKRTSLPSGGVELFPGDESVLTPAGKGDAWDLSRVPNFRFLDQLNLASKPLTTEATLSALIGALGQRSLTGIDNQRLQLRELVRAGDQLRQTRLGLGAVTRLALSAYPTPAQHISRLTRTVAAVHTLSEWADGTRRDEDWQSGRARVMLRPIRRPSRLGRLDDRMSLPAAPPLAPVAAARAMLRQGWTRLITPPWSMPRQMVRPGLTGRPVDRVTAWQEIAGLATIAWSGPALPDLLPDLEPEPNPDPSSLQPAGSQDLIVVRTRHIGYRLAELSRIENIAPGETRDRRHRVETEISTALFEEFEHEEETTESLATTTRDELRTEIATQSAREMSLDGTVRASYRGPVAVDVEASAEFNQQSGVQTTAAGVHAVDVVDEASSTVRDRVLRRNEHRFRRLLAESNRHRFENLDPTGRVAQYYWLEKVQRVALFNYGRRMMYEFVIPEPASHLRALSAEAPPPQSTVPAPPTDYYTEILGMTLEGVEAEFTAGRLTQFFQINVDERPAPSWIEAHLFEETPGKPDEQFSTASADIVVPTGYEGTRVALSVQTSAEDKNIWSHLTLSFDTLKVHVRGRTLDDDMNVAEFGWHGEGSASLTDPDGLRVLVADTAVPTATGPIVAGTHKVGLLIENFSIFSVTIGVLATPTEETVNEYRRSLLASVVTDYRRQYEMYAAQVVASPMDGAAMLEDLSDAQSAELRNIERDEVKRAALAVIRNLDPHGVSPMDGVIPDVSGWFRDHRVEADELLFLEQAFEWEHMSFVVYGYHWSDREGWPVQIFGVRGGDRAFREFLKAGAARVQIPVRPGFAGFVDDYMMDRIVWSGGPRPEMGSPGYVDFITEMSEHLGAPAHEQPQTELVNGDRHRPIVWDVVTPTDLVMLKVWPDGAPPPLERMIPPTLDSLTVTITEACKDPLSGWASGTGTVPDDPSS